MSPSLVVKRNKYKKKIVVVGLWNCGEKAVGVDKLLNVRDELSIFLSMPFKAGFYEVKICPHFHSQEVTVKKRITACLVNY